MGGGWDLERAVEQAIRFREERDWRRYHTPKNLVAGLAVEAAELQELFLWREPETAEQVAADEALMARVREELSDVVVYAVTLAHGLGIDLAAAMEAKIEANARKYPIGPTK
jgi:dCTP diphosphatase